MSNEVTIHLVEGKTAPRYDTGTELQLEAVIITEQGTKAGLPMVDFQMRGPDGKLYLVVLTGRIVNGISAAVKGINKRIHGVEEP